MTTFEITIIVLLAAIVVLLIVLLKIAVEGFRGVWQNQNAGVEQLCNIEVNTHHASSVLKDHIVPNIECIYNAIGADGCNNFKKLSELTDIVDKMHRNLCVEIADKMVNRIYPDKESMNKIDWDKLSKEQQDEFLKRLIMPNYDKPFQPIYTPCYSPYGICTNPQMDCINCPKRGTGGTWSTNTSIKAEDAPLQDLQEMFNDNK